MPISEYFSNDHPDARIVRLATGTRRMSEMRGSQAAAVFVLLGLTRSTVALPATVAAAPQHEPYAPSAVSPGAESYVLNCQGCHGARGEVAGGDIQPLAYAFREFTRTARGRAYLMRVPGIATAPIADGPLTELLNYLANLWRSDTAGHAIPQFNAADVGKLRRKPLVDIAAERTAVVSEMAAARLLPERIAK